MIAERKVAMRMARSGDRLDLALLTPRDRLGAEERNVVTLMFAERAWTSTKNLRTPATARQNWTLVVRGGRTRARLYLFGLAGIAAYVWAGVARTENLLFGGCGVFLLGGVMMVAFVLVALANRFRIPAPVLFAVLTTLAAALPAISMIFLAAQDTFPFITPLFVTMCLFGLTASELIFVGAATSPGSADRRHARAASKEAGRNLKTDDSVRAIGLDVTADGFRSAENAWVSLQLIGLVFVIIGVGVLRREVPNLDPIYFILMGVIVGLVTIDRVMALLRQLRRPATALQAIPQRSDRFAPQFSTPSLTTAAEIRAGPGSGYPFRMSGVTDGVTWTVESTRKYHGGDDGFDPVESTLWRTDNAAIKGVLQFWPRWPEVLGTTQLFPSDWDIPQFYLPYLLPSLGGSLLDVHFVDVTRLPIDDERLLTHYKVFSSPRFGAHNIGPRLKEVLINFAGSMHRRPEGSSAAVDPLFMMMLIMFWPKGLLILCNTATTDPKIVKDLAAFGAACANSALLAEC